MLDALREFKAAIFQALAHPTRVAIVEMLRDGEVSAGAIFEHLRIEPANCSQHLAVLRSRQIVIGRKEGNQVFYSLRDPSIVQVLDILRAYFERHLTESLGTLNKLRLQDLAASASAPDDTTQEARE